MRGTATDVPIRHCACILQSFDEEHPVEIFDLAARQARGDTYIGLDSETLLYPARIYPVQMTPSGYIWQWRSEDGAKWSRGGFPLFYECLEDARAHGFEPRLKAASEDVCELVIDPLAFDGRVTDETEAVRGR
jgi:hypothetical protein